MKNCLERREKWELSVLRRETKVQTIKEQSQEQVRTAKYEKGRLRERDRRANGVMNISSSGTQSGVRNALKSGISAAYFTHTQTDIVYVFSRKYWVMK